ncbi:MAG TPA: hypothetical protein VFC84_18910 [Desulfosporosinus sp.]|nr:hypothetical protein [Desulfosporosinus sp.]
MMNIAFVDIISEFNKETKNNLMQMAPVVNNNRNPEGTFCVMINEETYVITFEELTASLNKGYAESAVKNTIYQVLEDKIKAV